MTSDWGMLRFKKLESALRMKVEMKACETMGIRAESLDSGLADRRPVTNAVGFAGKRAKCISSIRSRSYFQTSCCVRDT